MPTLSTNASVAALAEVLGAARALGHRAWDSADTGDNGAMNQPLFSSDLIADVNELFALLRSRGVNYLLVGGVALLKYVDGRNTQDIDLLLSVDSLNQLPEIVIDDRNRDFARGKFKQIRIDLLLTNNPLFALVQKQHASTHHFAEMTVPCATVEGLILLKLYALPSLYRQGEGQRIGLYENDIFMLCERYRPKIEPLLETLKAFIDEGAMKELANITDDIQKRIARVDRAKQKR